MAMVRHTVTLQERLHAVAMIQTGLSHRHVALVLNRDCRVIDRLWNIFTHTGSVTDMPRSGRPRYTSARQDRYIVTSALRQRIFNSRRLGENFRTATNVHVLYFIRLYILVVLGLTAV